MPFLHHSLIALVTSLLFGTSLAAGRIIAIHATDENGFTVVNGGSDAVPGDILEFHFLSKNHSVVMGDPSAPCHPVATGGFFSGFLPTPGGENGNVFHVLINDTLPLFFYCAQTTPTNACAAGMVGAINASPAALEKYKCDAAGATTAVIPDVAATPYGGVVVPLDPKTVVTGPGSYTGTGTGTVTWGVGGTETAGCTTGAGSATGPSAGATGITSTTSYGGGTGGVTTPGATTATPQGSGSGTETSSGTPGVGDPGATIATDVPTTNGVGRVALVREGTAVMFRVVVLFGLMV